MTPEEFQFVRDFVAENQKNLSRKEQAFITLVTAGQMSPTAAARKLGYRSPATMGAKIAKRPAVHNVLLAYVEMSRELIRMIEAEESADNGI